MSKKKAHSTWLTRPLGEKSVASIGAGGTPRRSVHRYFKGQVLWAKIGDLTIAGKYIADTEEKITDEAIINSSAKVFPAGTVLVSMYGSIGKASIALVPIATNQAIVGVQTNPNVLCNEYLYYYLLLIQPHLEKLGRGATQNNINAGHVKELHIPVPPLPVQEQIIQILKKADQIRFKRQEAMDLADSILPAMYREVFGEADANPRGWKIDTLGNYLLESRYGTSVRTGEFQDGDPVLRIPNVIQRTIDTNKLKYLKLEGKEREKLLLQPGDILVVRTNGNKDYVGRCAVFDLEDDFLFASYLIRLRVDPEQLDPNYVVAYLATSMGRQEIDTNSRTSAGQYNISAEGLKAIRIPVPPLYYQRKFLNQYDKWKGSKARLEESLNEADDLFSGVLARSFTGELSAEWELMNADWITLQSNMLERLPRLLLLAIIQEYSAHVKKPGRINILVTALMKYAFLLQMERWDRHRFYRFVPYHYGPFAKELYDDLKQLKTDGLVTVDNDTDEYKTRITITDPALVDVALAEIPDDLKEDIATIIDTYGNLVHKKLLKVVYEKYPAYTKKSKLRTKPKVKKKSTRKK